MFREFVTSAFGQERFSVVTGNYYRNSDGQALSEVYMGLAEWSSCKSWLVFLPYMV